MRITLPSLALLLLGCQPAVGTVDPTSNTDTGTTTGTTTGSSTTLVKDWWINGSLEVSATAQVPDGDVLVVALPYMGLVSEPTGETEMIAPVSYGEVYRRVNIGPVSPGDTVPFSLGMPDLPEDERFEVEPYSGAEIASFVVGAFIDQDGDDQAGDGDHFVAAGIHHISFVRGAGEETLMDFGAEEGWNSFWYDDFYTGEATVTSFSGDLTPYPLTANLLPLFPQEGLGCTVRSPIPDTAAGEPRVDIYSINALAGLGAPANSTLMSAAVEADTPNQYFQFASPTPAPPADHLLSDLGEGTMPGVELALYMGIAYLDLDGDGQLDPMVDAWVTDNSEETVAPADNRTLIYIHPTGWEATWYTSFMGGAGWSVFTEDPSQYEAPPIPVPWSEGLVLGRN